MTSLDEIVSDGTLQMLKASLPYLPAKGQKLFSLCAKFLEFKHTVDLFSRSTPELSACELPGAPAVDPMSMLNDIRRFCGPGTRGTIDQLINLLVLAQMMELFRQTEESPSGSLSAQAASDSGKEVNRYDTGLDE